MKINSFIFLLLILEIYLINSQFSSYVSEYLFEEPEELIKPVPIIEPIDDYLDIKVNEQVVTQIQVPVVQTVSVPDGVPDSVPNSVPDSVQAIQEVQTNGRPNIKNQNGQGSISLPTNLNQPVNPIKPTNSSKTFSLIQFLCPFPLKRISGECRCPNNFQLISGKCINNTIDPENSNPGGENTGTTLCPVLKIGRINQSNPLQRLALISRTIDGTNNNERITNWGSAGVALERRVRANYADELSVPLNNLPEPRVISNLIGSQKNPIKQSRLNATIAFTIFGQFVDHDIDLTPAQTPKNINQQKMEIRIPAGDPFFKTQRFIDFSRSQFITGSSPRKHPNVITAWIDGSQIYGSDSKTNCALRSFVNGKLKATQQGNTEFLPVLNNSMRAGDSRALENMILTSYHIIFLREHNRLCDRILRVNPRLNDETVYQIARNYVIGLLQKIYIKDFVPILLGDSYETIMGQYNGYRKDLNPNIPTQFSTACYRLGHSLLINTIPLINQRGKIIQSLRLNQLFFNQNLLNENFIANIMRGSSKTKTKEKSAQLVDDVRNLLTFNRGSQVKLDLFSLNIQRGRDHGLPTYNQARSAFGLQKVKSFKDLVPSSQLDVAKKLEEAYGNINQMELFVGIISQKPVQNGIVGELGAKVVGQTFRNLRDADRFWYEKTFPESIIEEIESTTLGDIIRRNTNAKDISQNVFLVTQ